MNLFKLLALLVIILFPTITIAQTSDKCRNMSTDRTIKCELGVLNKNITQLLTRKQPFQFELGRTANASPQRICKAMGYRNSYASDISQNVRSVICFD